MWQVTETSFLVMMAITSWSVCRELISIGLYKVTLGADVEWYWKHGVVKKTGHRRN